MSAVNESCESPALYAGSCAATAPYCRHRMSGLGVLFPPSSATVHTHVYMAANCSDLVCRAVRRMQPPPPTAADATVVFDDTPGRLGNDLFAYAAAFGIACASGARLMRRRNGLSVCGAFPAARGCSGANAALPGCLDEGHLLQLRAGA